MAIAAILARVSRKTQETESQINSLISIAEEHGYSVPSKYIFQEKITGMDDPNKGERLSIQQLKNAILNDNQIECVYAWELTRISREPFQLIDMVKWFNMKRIPIYIYDAEVWTLDPITKEENIEGTNYIFGAATYGKKELEKIRRRTMRGRDEKAKKGLFVGHVSDGYTVEIINKEKHIIIDPERVELVKYVFDLYCNKGYSTNQIAAELNEKHILPYNAYEAKINQGRQDFEQSYFVRGTKKKKSKLEQKWIGTTIGNMLKNTWYIGERYYKGVKYPVPPIIDINQFKIAESKLESNRTMPKNRKSVYLLSNLLFCGLCGEKMIGHKVRINSSYYCSSLETGKKCGLEGIAKQNIEAIVWNAAVNAAPKEASDSDILDYLKISPMELQNIQKEIQENKDSIIRKEEYIKATKKELTEYFKDKAIAKTKYEKESISELIKDCSLRIEKTEKQIKDILSKNITLQTYLSNNENVENVFGTMLSITDLPTMKEVLAKIIKKVTLYNFPEYDKLILIEFVSGKKKGALYNSRKLKGRFFLFDSHYFESTSNLYFNEETKTFISKCDYIVSGFIGNIPSVFEIIKEKNVDVEEELKETTFLMKGKCQVYNKNEYTISDIRSIYKNNAWAIERIEAEPNDEEYKNWKQDYKRWSIIRNERRREKRREQKKN